MGIIPGLKSGIKGRLSRISPDWLIVAIILLSASGSFGLGFLAGKDVGQKGELEITQRELLPGGVPVIETSEEVESAPAMNAGGQYVASKTGKSYHLPWCSGAKLIKEENKVWFSSKEEAEARGYTPAGNCPGI
jgi:hypothetical protein